jgi:peptidoglycan LD-endopeptidase LytH
MGQRARMAGLVVVVSVGCVEVAEWTALAPTRARARERTSETASLHTLYLHRLKAEAEDPRVLAWERQAVSSLLSPVAVTLPSREAVQIGGVASEALALRFEARRGQRLVVELESRGTDEEAGEPIFVDVFAEGEPDRGFVPLVSGTSIEGVTTTIGRDGAYLLRLQPTLGLEARAIVSARLEPSIGFPVAGKDPGAVASTFGAPRDGGRRQHHGIDIFAPRGTKAVAAATATVLHVGTNRLGGNVVWLRADDPPLVLYYAHLERALVERGQRLEAGAVVGEVGNSGNARSTAPHLHFGIYGRGPIDPHPFVARARGRAPALRVGLDRLGRWLRVPSGGTRLRAQPDASSPSVTTLARGSAVLTKGARGSWLRVELPDGTVGWLPANRVRPWPKRRATPMLDDAAVLLRAPAAQAPAIVEVEAASALVERAKWGDWRLVETADGEVGWILPSESAAQDF